MSARLETSSARANAESEGEVLTVTLSGGWHITERRPSWIELLDGRKPTRVRLRAEALERWDTSVLLFLFEVQRWCRDSAAYCDVAALPKRIRALLAQLTESYHTSVPFDRSDTFLKSVGLATQDTLHKTKEISHFVGETVLSAAKLAKSPHKFRWRDCIDEMQQCGAMALPIVSLISLLVGLIMAYQAAVQLRQFGADIYVADLVGLAVVREMGPMMAAIILAGRTGAAFAATLANMKANEEIDALETLGIPAVHFLVLPRLVALAVMMPMLALYADGLGILGGMIVGAGVLQIPPAAYWVETQSIIDMSDVTSGLIKALMFGLLIGLAGCLRGLQAERSSMGVGRAATSAVVTAILLIIVADALFAIAFNVLGI
ncbi:MAG: ABC transporter permease [Opitutaceae bacterium]